MVVQGHEKEPCFLPKETVAELVTRFCEHCVLSEVLFEFKSSVKALVSCLCCLASYLDRNGYQMMTDDDNRANLPDVRVVKSRK